MILEVADIRIPPGKNAEFEDAIGEGLATVIAPRATGYIAHKVQRGIESPERYLLMIWWQALENHTVDFRQGPLFAEWRSFIGPVLAVPPHVEHFDLALASPCRLGRGHEECSATAWPSRPTRAPAPARASSFP